MTSEGTADESLRASEASVTKLRFELSGMREWINRVWAAMQGADRGPDPDYTPFDDERRILVNIIREQVKQGGGNNYNESGSSLLKWILGVLAMLTVSVVVGGITVYGRFTSLETRVSEWQKSTDRRLDILERRP